MEFRYGMRLRGFSPGCQPKDGFLEREDDPSGKYYDILVYNRKLTDKELRDYELDELKGRKIEITMEICYRMAKEVWVTEEEYKEIEDGCLPDHIFNDMEDEILGDLDHVAKDIDWTVDDCETGEQLQGWG